MSTSFAPFSSFDPEIDACPGCALSQCKQARERRAEGFRPALEIEAAHILAIEEAALDRRIGAQRTNRMTRIEAQQVIDKVLRRALAFLHGRPPPDQPAQHGGPILWRNFGAKSIDVDIVPNGNGSESAHLDNLSDLARGARCRSE